MKTKFRFSANPFAWLAFIGVSLNIFAHFTTTSIALVTYFLIGSVFLYAISTKRFRNATGSWYVLYTCLLLGYVFIVAVGSSQAAAGMSRMIIFQMIVCACLFIYAISNTKGVNAIICLVALSVVILCLMILADKELFETIKQANEENVYYSMGENNRNVIGVILGTGAVYMLYLGMNKNKLWFVPMILAVVLGMVTGSRKSVLAFCLGALLYVFLYGKFVPKQKNKKRGDLLLVIFLLVALFYACFNNEILYNILGSRLEGAWETIFGSGEGEASAIERSKMIQSAWEMFKQKPLFGWGIEGFASNSGFGVYSHNNYTETLVSFGLIGFVFMYFLKLKLIVNSIKMMKIAGQSERMPQFTLTLTLMIVSIVLDFVEISMNNVVNNMPFTLAAAEQLLTSKEKRN